MAKQLELGKLSDFRVFLINADGSRKVKISGLIRQLSITEDIFKNTMYGSVRIKDAIDLLGGLPNSKTIKGFPILGEEFLSISYTSEYTKQTVNLRFAVYSISDIVYFNNNTKKEYTLNFCSEEHLIDATTVVWKKYSKQHSDNVKDICKDYLNLDVGTAGPSSANPAQTKGGNVGNIESSGDMGFPTNGSAIDSIAAFNNKKKLVVVEETRKPQDIIIPRLSPMQALELIARRSISANEEFNSGSYLFFENFSGYNFCCLERLIKDGMDRAKVAKPAYTYYYENPLIREEKQPIDQQREFKTIFKAEHINYFDTIEKIKMGMFESDITIYDFVNHKTESKRYRFLKDGKNDTMVLGGLNGKAGPENSISFMKTAISEDDKSNKYSRKFFIPKDTSDPSKDTFLEDIYRNRASYFTRLGQNIFTIHTYGDTNIKAGDVIRLNIPEGDGSATKGASKVNKFISGYWLVGTIRHVFTQTSYQTAMDIYKNGFGDQVKSTDEAEIDPPPLTDVEQKGKNADEFDKEQNKGITDVVGDTLNPSPMLNFLKIV
jgi:hypothetical protein